MVSTGEADLVRDNEDAALKGWGLSGGCKPRVSLWILFAGLGVGFEREIHVA